MTRNHNFIIYYFLGNYLKNKWPIEVCHILIFVFGIKTPIYRGLQKIFMDDHPQVTIVV